MVKGRKIFMKFFSSKNQTRLGKKGKQSTANGIDAVGCGGGIHPQRASRGNIVVALRLMPNEGRIGSDGWRWMEKRRDQKYRGERSTWIHPDLRFCSLFPFPPLLNSQSVLPSIQHSSSSRRPTQENIFVASSSSSSLPSFLSRPTRLASSGRRQKGLPSFLVEGRGGD